MIIVYMSSSASVLELENSRNWHCVGESFLS